MTSLDDKIKAHGERMAEKYATQRDMTGEFLNREKRDSYLAGYEEGLKVGKLAQRLEDYRDREAEANNEYLHYMQILYKLEPELEKLLGETNE